MGSEYLVVGAGFSGAVVARAIVETLDVKVVVMDERLHVAGNCHTERDLETDVMVHRYGPHIFHTNRKDVWDYVQRYASFEHFSNRVKAHTPRGVFSLPINLLTINQLFGRRFAPAEAMEFLDGIRDTSITHPRNFEEQALSMVGRDIYETFFLGYTKKHWGCDPKELPASILKRLPVRFDYNDNYYDSRYQGIPRDGYTALVERILDHERIRVVLSTAFTRSLRDDYKHVFYTGPIDSYFQFSHGRLGYRTVHWTCQRTKGDALGNAVINFTGEDVKHTRLHEHKHFAPWESHKGTVVFTEFSKATEPGDIPYYPTRLASDKEAMSKYASAMKAEERISFLGRLATYRYLDMHQVIGEALDFAHHFCRVVTDGQATDVGFSNYEKVC